MKIQSNMLVSVLITTFFCSSTYAQVRLAVPNLSDDAVISRIAGIRSCRSQLRLEVEKLQRFEAPDKLVIHNYGHGGAGIFLAWGSAYESVRLLKKVIKEHGAFLFPENQVAVLGAGIIGLTVAHLLLDAHYDVVVYAKDFPPNTPLNIAGGLWTSIFAQGDKEISEEIQRRDKEIKEFSFACLSKLADVKESGDKPEYEGVSWIDYYDFSSDINLMGQEKLVEVQFMNGLRRRANKSKTILIDSPVYIQSVFEDGKKRGIKFVKCSLAELQNICDFEESVVINCTDFGAKELCEDADIKPVCPPVNTYFKK